MQWTKWQGLSLLLLVGALISQLLTAGCSLCTKRLYLYRDTPEKQLPTSDLVLLITDPNLVKAVMSLPGQFSEEACQWAPEQQVYESDSYRLSIDGLDGKPVYQGLCLDTTTTYACEVRPGNRQIRVRLDMFGPWGQRSVKDSVRLDLKPGASYFLKPDCAALKDKRLVLMAGRLPAAYSADLRGRIIDWARQNLKGRSITD